MKKRGAGLVYTTESGRTCGVCGWPKDRCSCSAPTEPPGDGNVRVGRETKGRAGKGVTVITGLPLRGAELETLASELKRRCGSGGTVKDGVVEIQGDHRDALLVELTGRGFSVKRSGG
ncbi:MAG: translation initiation factor Sui1 [Acidobacteriota bacterium]